MKIIVNPHSLELEKTIDVNSGEYNIQECEFEFSNEYNGLTKMAIFSNEDESFETLISDNKCVIPSEILQNDGTIALGVYGYEINEDKLVKRYSPKPVFFNVELGSYQLAQESVDPSSDIIAQILQQLGNQAQDIITLENNYDNLVDNVIPTLATKEEIPDVSQYATTEALGTETTNRENADIGLQGQIDAITSSSDVKDIVGTYTDLQNYDTSKLGNDDIVKVLQDSTHNDAMAYYRWVITEGTGAWSYIGQEGPYYTKSETGTLLQSKQDTLVSGTNIKTINNQSLLGSGDIQISGGSTPYIFETLNVWNTNIDNTANRTVMKSIYDKFIQNNKIELNNVMFHLYRIGSTDEKIYLVANNMFIADYYISINFYEVSENGTRGGAYGGSYNRKRKYTINAPFNSSTGELNSISISNSYDFGITTTEYGPITTNNTNAFTPTGDYNPATKKYVDDSISSAIGTALQGNY